MKPKLTPWYPGHIKPVREGWYQVQCDEKVCSGQHYFDGTDWSLFEFVTVLVESVPWRGMEK